MQNNSIIPVILCGGTGSRLWPLSRKSFPKQYLKLDIDEKYTLLQSTQKRISNMKNILEPILICNEDHRFIVAEQMKEININPKAILLEPIGKNTAPAITLAALKALDNKEDSILLVMSSDHKVDLNDKFVEVLEKGAKYAQQGRIVNFGVIPTSPETGYGYIEAEDIFSDSNPTGSNILSFKEKPNLETAKKFIEAKRFLWNSGIFMFKAKVILSELEKYNPNLIRDCQKSLKPNLIDLDFQRLDNKFFSQCPNISIDVAVMEKTNLGTVLPLDVGWSDIGNWKSVWETSKKDKHGNKLIGNTLSKDSENCYIRSEKRLIVSLGMKNSIVIETSDAILIADNSYAQDVKDIVQKLEDKKIKEGREHKKIYRPWGHYISVVDGDRWQVKLISVKPGEMLSLQMHHHRSEHWVVVNGTAKVEINNKETILCENQSTYIPLGSTHRLSNPGKIPLLLIEVQSGTYIGEDDIERIEDNYGRITK